MPMSIDPARKKKLIREHIFYGAVIALMMVSVIIMCVAVFDKDTSGEAYTGSFETSGFNEGWKLDGADITLPATVDAEVGDEVTISNTLPADISDGSTLMIRSSMEDIRICVDGDLRSEYATESIKGAPYYIPSAYVAADLNEEDAGKEITVSLKFKAAGAINEVVISHGNNAWFRVIRDSLPVNLIAMFVLAVGAIIV